MSGEDSGMTTDERLVYMVNQIARNFAAMGEARAIAATEDHLLTFWDPRMKARIIALAGGGMLSPVAAAAVAAMRAGVEPAPQTRATRFAAGGSDAG